MTGLRPVMPSSAPGGMTGAGVEGAGRTRAFRADVTAAAVAFIKREPRPTIAEPAAATMKKVKNCRRSYDAGPVRTAGVTGRSVRAISAATGTLTPLAMT